MISNHISFAYDAPVSSCLSSDQIQIHTERYSSSEIFFFFFFLPVIESRWERNSLYWLHVYSIHWRSVVNQVEKPSAYSCCYHFCLVNCTFANDWKAMGKEQKRGPQCLGITVSWPILPAPILGSWLRGFLFLCGQGGSRLSGSLTLFWQWLPKMWLRSRGRKRAIIKREGV